MFVWKEIRRLEHAFDARVRAMSGSAAETSEGLLARLDIRPERRDSWTARLGPLTLLYPLLQCEGLPEVRAPKARHATLAHLFFLVHTFLEDRIADGQLIPDERERAFSEKAREEGFRILEEEGIDARVYNRPIVDRHTPVRALETDRDPNRIRRYASARALYGLFATNALVQAHGIGETRLRCIQNAFYCTATGLQWYDDFDDWREDLTLGDENLLLARLPADGLTEDAEQVALALRAAGIFDLAADQARRWFEMAIARQRTLRCSTLRVLIEERVQRLRTLPR